MLPQWGPPYHELKIPPCPATIMYADQPEVTWTTQASEQRGSNLGEGSKPPEQWVFSQYEDAWKGLTHPAASPAQHLRKSQQPVWFLSSPSLSWPGGGQEIETPLLRMAAALRLLVSAPCQGLGCQPKHTPRWGEPESGSHLPFLSISCGPR